MKTDRYKQIEYNITDDPEFIADLFRIPRELQEQFESLHNRSIKGGEGIIRRLKKLIGQYPHVPQLKNYLSGAYMNSGMSERAYEINHRIIHEHPGYIFGKLNLAHEYFHNERFDRIPEVLGDMIDLRELCPGREQFHLSEVTAFLKISIMYFCTTGNLKAAESRFDILDELAPGHPDTEEARSYLMEARLEAAAGNRMGEKEAGMSIVPDKRDNSIRPDRPPEFIHKETEWLYENDMTIGREKLATLLSLPRETLVSDLTMVLKDAIDRQDHFIELAEDGELQTEDTHFAIHAIYLLGQLRSTEGLPVVLETLSQGEEFIDIWLGDFITGSLWEPLYFMGNNQLDLLKEFVLSPGLYTYARTEVCSSVIQIAQHQPHRKEEVTAWFDDLFSIMVRRDAEEDVVDKSFIGLAVYDAVKLREPALLPVIEVLFNRGYVDEFLYRSFDKIAEDVAAPPRTDDKRELMNIYDRYQQVVTTWAGYTEDEEDETDDEIWDDDEGWDDDEDRITGELLAYRDSWPDRETGSGTGHDPEPHTPKTGRNDPCPCGSGKKYKKCCLV